MPQERIYPNPAKCDKCGKLVVIGASPLCKDGHSTEHTLFRSGYAGYIDEHIAPPPGPDFNHPSLPDYDHRQGGYKIRSHDDVRTLMKLNKMDYKSKRGHKGQEI